MHHYANIEIVATVRELYKDFTSLMLD